MELRNYLIQNPNLEEFSEKFKVKIKRSKSNPSLLLFKYNDIPVFNSVIRKQCRGIILDENDQWKIISYPYDKFFNMHEKEADQLILNKNTKIYTKHDGSLMVLYYYNNEWNVSSSGNPDASGDCKDTKLTYNKLFWKIFSELQYQIPDEKNHCFIFELVSPLNKIIVNYDKNDLVLHGVRNLDTLIESDHITFAKKYNWNFSNYEPYEYSLEHYKNIIDDTNPHETEGVIVCDEFFKRIKIKSIKYLNLAHMNQKNYKNKYDKFLHMKKNGFDPEIFLIDKLAQQEYENFENKLAELEKEIDIIYHELINVTNNQKDFFMNSKIYWYQNALLLKKSNKYKSIDEWIIKYVDNNNFINYIENTI